MARLLKREGAVGTVLFLFIWGFVLAGEEASGERGHGYEPVREETLSAGWMMVDRMDGPSHSALEGEGPSDRAKKAKKDVIITKAGSGGEGARPAAWTHPGIIVEAGSGVSREGGARVRAPCLSPDRAAGFAAGTGASWSEDGGQPSPPRSFFVFFGDTAGRQKTKEAPR